MPMCCNYELYAIQVNAERVQVLKGNRSLGLAVDARINDYPAIITQMDD